MLKGKHYTINHGVHIILNPEESDTERHYMNKSDKFNTVVSMNELTRLGEFYRKLGKKIVTTNGCFDLMHAGHVRMLTQARRKGDVLVVGLNSDESVRTLKGPSRPLIDENQRVELLSALRMVDHVVVFNGLLPNDMLEQLKPDVHCKAADYSPESLPEAEVVRRNGGRIEILPLSDGLGTSELLNLAATAASAEKNKNNEKNAGEYRQARAGDTASWAISRMLSFANLQRQAAYRLGDSISEAAKTIADTNTRGGNIRIWFSPGLQDSAVHLASRLNVSLAGVRTECTEISASCMPQCPGSGDLLLILGTLDVSNDVVEMVDTAVGSGMKLIVLDSSEPSDLSSQAGVHVAMTTEDSAEQICILCPVVINTLADVLDHIATGSAVE